MDHFMSPSPIFRRKFEKTRTGHEFGRLLETLIHINSFMRKCEVMRSQGLYIALEAGRTIVSTKKISKDMKSVMLRFGPIERHTLSSTSFAMHLLPVAVSMRTKSAIRILRARQETRGISPAKSPSSCAL